MKETHIIFYSSLFNQELNNMIVESKTGIRRADLSDLNQLRNLVIDTISSICRTDYNDSQIWAWISGIDDVERWKDVLLNQFAIVSYNNETITGFCSLDEDHIDLFYVHRDYQGQGLAKKLFIEIEQEAKRQSVARLTSDVSLTAKPFFKKMGFSVLTPQKVRKNGIELINFKMVKEEATKMA